MIEKISNIIFNFAFWYDRTFCSNLSIIEEDWSLLDKLNYKVFSSIYFLEFT